jgi:hypothetical protein
MPAAGGIHLVGRGRAKGDRDDLQRLVTIVPRTVQMASLSTRFLQNRLSRDDHHIQLVAGRVTFHNVAVRIDLAVRSRGQCTTAITIAKGVTYERSGKEQPDRRAH